MERMETHMIKKTKISPKKKWQRRHINERLMQITAMETDLEDKG